jgi:hypothetical protein
LGREEAGFLLICELVLPSLFSILESCTDFHVVYVLVGSVLTSIELVFWVTGLGGWITGFALFRSLVVVGYDTQMAEP